MNSIITEANLWFALFNIACGVIGWQWITIRKYKQRDKAAAIRARDAQM